MFLKKWGARDVRGTPTLRRKQRTRYVISKCFDFFPLVGGWTTSHTLKTPPGHFRDTSMIVIKYVVKVSESVQPPNIEKKSGQFEMKGRTRVRTVSVPDTSTLLPAKCLCYIEDLNNC